MDDLTRDIRTKVGGEEERHVGHILGGATATQRNQTFPLFADVLWQGVGHGGDDKAWSDGVVADVAHTHFLGCALREADDTSLRGAVVALVGIARHAHHRAHVDDATTSLLPHDGLHGLGEVEYRLEVHIDDGIPLLLGHALQRCVLGDTRIVDEDVDAAEVFDDFVDDLVRLLKVGSVGSISLDFRYR